MTNGDMADKARDEINAELAQAEYRRIENRVIAGHIERYPDGCPLMCETCVKAHKEREVFSGGYPWGPPSEKSPEIEELLEDMSGRTASIKGGTCLAAPIGCSKEITGFKDALSQKEYSISGLCQECQDKVFG